MRLKPMTLKFLDHIDQPVFLVGFDGGVQSANPSGSAYLATAPGLGQVIGGIARDAAESGVGERPLPVRLPGDNGGLRLVTLFRMHDYWVVIGNDTGESVPVLTEARLGALQVIAGEIRQPVLALLEEARTLAQRMREGGSAPADAWLAHFESRIRAFEHVGRLLEQMGPEQFEADGREAAADLLQTALDAVCEERDGNGITLDVTLPDGGLPTLFGPVDWYRQVITLYLRRAIHHAKASALVVRVRAIAGFLYIRIRSAAAGSPGATTHGGRPGERAEPAEQVAAWGMGVLGGYVATDPADPAAAVIQVPLFPASVAGGGADQAQIERFAADMAELLALKHAGVAADQSIRTDGS